MPSVPIAAFLAGALLTLLLPVLLLIALVVWYWLFSVRVPETAEQSTPSTAPTAAIPGTTATAADPAPSVSSPQTGPPAHEA